MVPWLCDPRGLMTQESFPVKSRLTATERGHDVTLYEKSSALGGLFNTFEDVSFKWPHKDFKNYLVRQVEKADIDVNLNT